MTRHPFGAAMLAATVASITLMAGCASTPAQQPAAEAIDDGVVTAKVRARLLQDPMTQAHQINVETFKGTVQLRGYVETDQARTRALELAKDVTGVKRVKDAMDIRIHSKG
jgi:osmotically-inducible protein OsmY